VTEDQIVAIYGSIKTLAQGMAAREAALDKKTAELDVIIAELKQLPLTLGKQTGQYIGMGVRQAMEQDFSPPIKEVFQPPIAELKSVLRNARESIQEVSRYAKYQTLVWMLSLAGIGFVAGAGVTFLYLGSKIDALREQVVAVQQQIAPAAPVSSLGGPSKPSPKNGHSGSGVKPKPPSHAEPAAAPAPDAAEPPQ
jgi:hypothetical protein